MRIKLQAWDGCLDDSLRAIELQPESMKGYYYLAQAQLALHHPNEALNSAQTAYRICLATQDSSTSNISSLILECKKQKWEVKERDRIRRQSDLLRELEDGLTKTANEQVQQIDERIWSGEVKRIEGQEEREEILASTQRKINDLQSIFAISDPANLTRRVRSPSPSPQPNSNTPKKAVPDYLIDNISFAIMHDPVITKTGNSYDRSTLLEHLRRSSTDPLTREPLKRENLRPNLALKQACAEFLEENGWAVDW